MYKVLALIILPVLLMFTSCVKSEKEQSEYVIWFDKPAQEWTEALPIGNGRLGAMIFGKTSIERIQVNEESLWGGNKTQNDNPEALEHLPEIRKLILQGNIPTAMEMANKYIAGIPGKTRSYQTLGDIYFHFNDTLEPVTNYQRKLDLQTGVASVAYNKGDKHIEYEVFSSAPDNVMVLKFQCNKPGGLDMFISMTRPRDATITAKENDLVMVGQVIDETNSDLGPGGNDMKFYAKLHPASFDGEIASNDSTLFFRNGTELILIFNAATDYNINGLNFDPNINPDKKCNVAIASASEKAYKELLNTHIAEHRSFFDRVDFKLTTDHSLDSLPTDKRLERFRTGADDPGLITTYFQYGRYLLMGSSRGPAQLPANLQGIWNKDWWAPWQSDYHVNINLQMNYWLAEVCNLSETFEPVTRFMEELTVPGKVTAEKVYGAKGWTMHHTTDVFGKTSVLDGVYWGMFPLGGAWMTLHLWEHFLYTNDTTYLRERAYPVIKGSAEFIQTFLFEDNEGYLVTAPTYSPENSYIDPKTKKEFKLTYAPTMDIQIIREVLSNCQKAAKVLNIDKEFSEGLQNTMDKLPPVRIASNGTIMEWIKEYEEFEPGHRHISHLFGLHPGSQITPETPELFEAAGKTIEHRLTNGGGHTGWSRAWIINFYARLLNGEECYKHLRALLEKSTLPNLFDTHPPFQIDGNFGGTAGIAEMLLQSHNGVVRILPALPVAWPNGSIKGLKARGNFTIEIEWENSSLKTLKVISNSGGPVTIDYKGIRLGFETIVNEVLTLNNKLEKI